jgi:hypothetical protein
MPPVGFEPTISAGERPQTHALDRPTSVTGTGTFLSGFNSRTAVIDRFSKKRCEITCIQHGLLGRGFTAEILCALSVIIIPKISPLYPESLVILTTAGDL